MHICVRCKYLVKLTKLVVSRDTMVRITRYVALINLCSGKYISRKLTNIDQTEKLQLTII